MKCVLRHIMYRNGTGADAFVIGAFDAPDGITTPEHKTVYSFVGKGYGLPASVNAREGYPYELEGDWQFSPTHGWQFAIQTYRELVRNTPDGIKSYLMRTIRGVGPQLADKIFRAFGENTTQVLDEAPERLAEIKGISNKKAQDIAEQAYATRQARDVITTLAPHGISVRTCNRIVKEYGSDALTYVRKNPYMFCELPGFGFRTCDRIAAASNEEIDLVSRASAALLFVLNTAEQAKGHLCISDTEWKTSAAVLLRDYPSNINPAPPIDKAQLEAAAERLKAAKRVVTSKHKYADRAPEIYVYRYAAAKAEVMASRNLAALCKAPNPAPDEKALRKSLRAAELQCGVTLSTEQKEGVINCMKHNVSVITGGPGTGKTTVLRAVLSVNELMHPDTSVTLCAPTGKAARRMEEVTGYCASTIHSALGIRGEDDEPVMLETDFIVIDEISMLDIYIADKLLSSITPSTRVLFVGDSDQLPSVGPGAFLAEVLSSQCIPCTRLSMVYRQKALSRIAINAAHIRDGQTELEYGPDFSFVEAGNLDTAADIITNLYIQEIDNGTKLDEIIVLSPRRETISTSAYALAERIRACVNPPDVNKPEATRFSHVFRLNDRVIQQKNVGIVCNGDVGTIIRIERGETGESPIVTVDFGARRIVDYGVEDLDQLRLAYACTIHKSQGSEYETVIMTLSSSYNYMLQRNLVYTGITRAKKKVIIVGDKAALSTAILRLVAQSRQTMFAARLRKELNCEA